MLCRKVDPNAKIAYNGIGGSFSHLVALILFGKDATLMPAPDSRRLEEGLVSGKYDIGIMPVVNITAGAVTTTLDTLLNYHGQLQIVDSYGLLVDQRVGGFCNPRDVKYIASHPTAIDQCKVNLWRMFPGYIRLDQEDTAGAIKDLADDMKRLKAGDITQHYPDQLRTAVVGSKVAFEIYGVPMYEPEKNIADTGKNNITAFLWIVRRTTIPDTIDPDAAETLFGLNIRS